MTTAEEDEDQLHEAIVAIRKTRRKVYALRNKAGRRLGHSVNGTVFTDRGVIILAITLQRKRAKGQRHRRGTAVRNPG